MNLNDLYRKTNLTEGEQNYGPEWDEKVQRLGQMAAQGPRKTVWDPVKRVYKTVPVNAPKKEQGVAEGMPADNDMGSTTGGAKMTLGQWKQMWMKKMPNADFAAMFRSPPNMRGSAIAYFDGWVNNPDARWDPQQGVAEGVAETMPMDDAKNVLNHYGADYFKTTHDTLYFSKYRKQFSIGRIRDDDGAGSVNLRELNAMVRKLKGMRVPLSPFKEGVAEGAGPAVDDKGWTQRDWIDAVKRKFPGAKIIQSKMIDGPCQVTLPNGKTLHWAPAQGIAEGLNEFVTPQATAQDPGLEREKDVDVIIFGRMPQDFTFLEVIQALESVLPREYPPGSSQNTQGIPYSPAERIGQQIFKHGGAVVTTKPLSIAQKVVKEFQAYGIKCRIDAPGLEEGDNPWGNQGNFAGDTPVNVGGVSMKNIQVGDTVRYLEQPAKVVAMSKDRKHSRITISKGMGGVTQDVLTSDLQQLGRGMAEADEQPPAEPFKTGYPRVNNPKILGTQNRAKSAYHPPAKPPIKKLDKPLPESTGSRYHEQLAQQLPPGLQSEDDILNAAWPMAVNDLGQKAAKYNFNYDEDFLGDLISAYHSIQKSINEAGQNYHANRTGFTRGTRDPEGQDPQGSQQVWGLKINGNVWSKAGKDVTFTSKEAALKTRNAILKNRPDLEIGLVTRGGMTESDKLTEYGAPGSRALGTANFALLHRAYVNKRPKLSRNLRLEFGPNQAVDLDDDDIEAVAAHYDTLPTDQDRYNFVYDTMSRGDKFTALLRQLGRRGDLLEQDSKKKSNSPLDRKDVKSATLNTALRQAYAKYPQANSDIEALALHDLNYQQNTSQDLSTQAKTNQRQDSVDNQLKDVARKQSSKISDLDQENDELSAELDQLNQEINAMSRQVGITPKDTPKDSDKPSVINLNVGDRGERTQQRKDDVKQRDAQKSEPAVTTSPAMGQVAQSLANPPAPTIDVIDKPAVALPAKMGSAPAAPAGDGGEQLSMFGPEPEAVAPKSINTVNEPAAEIPSTMAAPDADVPDELPANVSDLEKARRTRDQLRQATRDQALNAIKTGTFSEENSNRSLFSSLLVMEQAKQSHRSLVCEMCGRTAADHPFRHPFKVSSK